VRAALNLLVLATVPVLPEPGQGRSRRRWKFVAASAACLLVVLLGAAVAAWKIWK
jgi:hypothetical protein